MNQNKEIASRIANATGKLTPLALQGKLESWKAQHFPKLMALASSKEEAERLYVVCMNTLSRSSRLLECTFDSIATCILTSFQLKLSPGPMQECAFIPFKDIATFIPMYQGILKLCYNSGFIKSIRVKVVYEGETFRYIEGMNPVLEHVPDLDIDHAKAIRKCVYCVIRTCYDDIQMTVLSPRFIAGIKARSHGAQKSDSPWNGNTDDVDAMWCKTAVKQALKLIPKSTELADAIEIDDAIETETVKGRIVDLTMQMPISVPQEEPQAIENQETGGEIDTSEESEWKTVPSGDKSLWGEDDKGKKGA